MQGVGSYQIQWLITLTVLRLSYISPKLLAARHSVQTDKSQSDTDRMYGGRAPKVAR